MKSKHRGSAKGRISHNFQGEALRARSREFLIKKFSDLCELRITMLQNVRANTQIL